MNSLVGPEAETLYRWRALQLALARLLGMVVQWWRFETKHANRPLHQEYRVQVGEFVNSKSQERCFRQLGERMDTHHPSGPELIELLRPDGTGGDNSVDDSETRSGETVRMD